LVRKEAVGTIGWPTFEAARAAADGPERELSRCCELGFGVFCGAESGTTTFVAMHL